MTTVSYSTKMLQTHILCIQDSCFTPFYKFLKFAVCKDLIIYYQFSWNNTTIIMYWTIPDLLFLALVNLLLAWSSHQHQPWCPPKALGLLVSHWVSVHAGSWAGPWMWQAGTANCPCSYTYSPPSPCPVGETNLCPLF